MSRAGFGVRLGTYTIDIFIIVITSSILLLLVSMLEPGDPSKDILLGSL